MPELRIYFKISEELAGTACFLLTVKTSVALAAPEPGGGTSPAPAACPWVRVTPSRSPAFSLGMAKAGAVVANASQTCAGGAAGGPARLFATPGRF